MEKRETTQQEKDLLPGHVTGRFWEDDERTFQQIFPQEGENCRVGVAHGVIHSAHELELLCVFLQTPFRRRITRNIVRAVVTEEVLRNPSPQLDGLLRSDLISLISLKDSGNVDLSDCYEVAFARDAPERRPASEHVPEQLAEAESIFLAARNQPVNLEKLRTLRSRFLCLRLTHESERSLVQSYRDLLVASFGLFEEAEELDACLSDGEAVILVAVPRDGPPEVAAGMYMLKETLTVSRNGKDIGLAMYRGDGGAVRSEFQGQGLYTFLHRESLSALARKKDALIDVVFGFFDISTPGALKGGAKSGYTLVTETAASFNFSPTPLRWQVEGKSVDEIVAYVPGNTLREVYGKGNEGEMGGQ